MNKAGPPPPLQQQQPQPQPPQPGPSPQQQVGCDDLVFLQSVKVFFFLSLPGHGACMSTLWPTASGEQVWGRYRFRSRDD